MMNSDDESNSSTIQTQVPKERNPALVMFSLVMVCFLIGYLNKLNLILYLALDLNDRDWPAASIGMGMGVIGFGGALAFIGGFLGDRTLKRRNWVWIGILVESFGILLVSTLSPAAIKIGLALFSLGLLFFQGNIIVVVAEYAVAAGIKIENALLIVFVAVSIGDILPSTFSGFLYERGLLFLTLMMLSLTCALLLLLATRHSSAGTNPDFNLIPLSSRRRIALLIFALLATRGVNLASNFAIKWNGESDNTTTSFNSMFDQNRIVWLIISGVIFLAILLGILLILRWLRKRNKHTVATKMLGIGLATVAFALLVIGLGAGDFIPMRQVILALASVLMSAGGAFLFIAMATLTLTLVTNRWRGTITALFVAATPGLNIMPLSWESWPLATPLLIAGAGILVISVFWYMLGVRYFKADQIISHG